MVKVIVSEWTRRAAHNLDTWREEWLSQKSPTVFVEPDLQKLQVDSNLDHIAILTGSYDRIIALGLRAKHDVGLLQSYLSKLGATKLIDGKHVPKHVFDAYRARIVKEMHYKQFLCTVTNEVARSKRMIVANGLRRPDHLKDMEDWELLSEYDRAFRDAMKLAVGDDWFFALSKDDQDLLSYVSKYLRSLRKTLPIDSNDNNLMLTNP